MKYGNGCIFCAAVAAAVLLSACNSISNPEEISTLEEAVPAMAAETTLATTITTTATTTTVTTTTTLSPYAPFIDYDREIDPDKPMLALTFDDGPSEQTGVILDALEEYQAHATFFVVGENVNEYTGEYIKRAVSLGCEIGSHTYDHSDLTSLTAEERESVVQKTDDAVFDLIGRYPYWLRPPYGSFNDTVQQSIEKPLAYWSVDTRDWESRDTASVVSVALNNIEDGDIVLMHDLYESTAGAVQQLLPTLVEQGYQLVTLSEMAYYRGFELENGMIVFDFHPDETNYKAVPEGTVTETTFETECNLDTETETTVCDSDSVCETTVCNW